MLQVRVNFITHPMAMTEFLACYSGWMEFDALGLISQIMTRVNNRTLVGLPLCMYSVVFFSCLVHYLLSGRDSQFSSDCISISRDAYQLVPPLPLFGSIVS